MSAAPDSWRMMAGGAAVVGTLAFALAWLNDAVTLQGERTIYTVECRDGQWDPGNACTGKLVAGERFRFRALRVHNEVLFWRAGVAESSGRLTQCTIQDGRNWKCPAGSDAARSITLEMEHGRPVRDADASGRTFHAVAKWRWVLLRWGLPAGSDTDVGTRIS